MGDLRDRMMRDMDVRNFSGRTVEACIGDTKGWPEWERLIRGSYAKCRAHAAYPQERAS